MRDNKPILLLYIGICLNLVLFFVAHYFKMPLLPYHTGTLYVATLLGSGAGILTAAVTFLAISLFCYGQDFLWMGLSGIIISVIVGEQLKKETRITNWLVAAGEVFLLDLFFYIFIVLWKNDSIPYDYAGQRIFMFFYEMGVDEVFSACLAALPVVLLTSLQSVLTAFVAILCTPARWLCASEEASLSKQKSLKRQKQKD
ncbi:MAG: hypothetical protein IJ278_04905 [Clostridia bacterium]|nr:hypothetical protein [Clostridia bacterium]